MRKRSPLKTALYVIGALALTAGLWGLYSRLFFGERDVNYGSYVTWGLWVAMYVFFAGVATGSAMIASLDYLFNVPVFKGTGKAALWAAVVTMPAALICIGLDLGHMERIWKVYLSPNFNSVMAQLVWGYTIFFILMIVLLVMVLRAGSAERPSTAIRVLMAVGFVLAVFLSGGVGALFGVNASRASWHVGFLPAQFPVFSLTSGVALMLIIFGWLNPARDERGDQLIKVLSLAMVMLLLVKAYYLWTDLSLALYSGVPQNVEAARTIMFGPYGWAFWVLQVGLGMLVPLAALLIPAIRRRSFLVGLMGLFVLVGMGVARANIIFPALTIPELEGLTTAFTGPHLTFSYTPSPMEWSVLSAVVGLAVLAYLIGVDTLPIFGEKPARGSGRTPVLPARPTEVAQ